MTVNDIYTHSLSFLSETPEGDDYLENYVVPWVNTLLVESFATEQLIRKRKKLPELPAIPRVYALEDEIPYQDELLILCLPYGLAAQMFIDDDNYYLYQDFRGRFIDSLNEMGKTLEIQIREDDEGCDV